MNFNSIDTNKFSFFVSYQYDLPGGMVRPTQNRWLDLTGKNLETFYFGTLSIIGHFMATEKQVFVVCLHIIPTHKI